MILSGRAHTHTHTHKRTHIHPHTGLLRTFAPFFSSLCALKKIVFTLSKSGSLQRERVNKNRCCKFSCALSLSPLSPSHTDAHNGKQLHGAQVKGSDACTYTWHKATEDFPGHFPQWQGSPSPTVYLHNEDRDTSKNIHHHTSFFLSHPLLAK